MNKNMVFGVFVGTIFIALTAAFIVSSTIVVAKTIDGNGQIGKIGVEVYSDSGGLYPISTIDWGILEPDEIAVRTVWIENTGNKNGILSLTTENWVPDSTIATLGWDIEGFDLAPDILVPATLTLQISATIPETVDAFSVDIVITATT